MSDTQFTYHEIDFLLPAQRFSIQFSYISQKGLSFYREYILRVAHIAPLSKMQIATFFGLSKKEVDEAVNDLVERGELTLSSNGRLTLTEKSKGYFSDLGEIPQLSSITDSGASLSFDLETFTCLGNSQTNDTWKGGIAFTARSEHASQSEKLVEKSFQRQFNQIYDKGFLPKSVVQEGAESPTIYTVNSVTKIRDLPLRLTTPFRMDNRGRAVERGDFEKLNSSESIHEVMAYELSLLERPDNFDSIVKITNEIEDKETLNLFDFDNRAFIPYLLEDINVSSKKYTFLGPLYLSENWALFEKQLAPILSKRTKSKTDFGNSQFIWVVPSDPFWGKSIRLIANIDSFFRGAKIDKKGNRDAKQLYTPTLYVPVSGVDDKRTARQWQNQLAPHHEKVKGLVEGFLDGNIEVILLEKELVVVVYHINQPEVFPVTLPVGFVSTDNEIVMKVEKLVKDYIQGSSGFDKPHDCGYIQKIAAY